MAKFSVKRFVVWLALAMGLGAAALALGGAVAASTVDPAFESLVSRLTADGLPEAKIRRLFSRAEMAFSPKAMSDKLTALYMRKYGLRLVADIQTRLIALGWHPGPADGKLDRMTRWSIKTYQAAEGLPQLGTATETLLAELSASPKHAPADLTFPQFPKAEVHDVVLTPERLGEAREFYERNRAALARARERFGVPEEYMVALLAVETRVGRYLGDEVAVVNLASLVAGEDVSRLPGAFAYEKPAPDRMVWIKAKATEKGERAYGELRALLRYAHAQGIDALSIPGSI